MRILLSGGGTAGHINPAIAIGQYIQENDPNAQILFVGAKQGMEGELVTKAGFNIRFIQVKGFRRKLSIDTLDTVRKMFVGFFESKKIIREFAPDVVIGTGGYVCGPVLFAAYRMGKKTMVHEQNVIPGVTVKLLSHIVDKTLISFPQTTDYISKNTVLTGNPLSKDLFTYKKDEARNALGFDKRPLLLVYGGSLGAKRINKTICQFIKDSKDQSRFQMIFATGRGGYREVMDELGDLVKDKPNIKIYEYIYNMPLCLAAADLVISRAGAMTVSELSATGKPAILIPSPNVAHNHQEYNARALEKNGAAVVITENQLSVDALKSSVNQLIDDDDRIKKMSDSAKVSGIIDATQTIYNTLCQLVGVAN